MPPFTPFQQRGKTSYKVARGITQTWEAPLLYGARMRREQLTRRTCKNYRSACIIHTMNEAIAAPQTSAANDRRVKRSNVASMASLANTTTSPVSKPRCLTVGVVETNGEAQH